MEPICHSARPAGEHRDHDGPPHRSRLRRGSHRSRDGWPHPAVDVVHLLPVVTGKTISRAAPPLFRSVATFRVSRCPSALITVQWWWVLPASVPAHDSGTGTSVVPLALVVPAHDLAVAPLPSDLVRASRSAAESSRGSGRPIPPSRPPRSSGASEPYKRGRYRFGADADAACEWSDPGSCGRLGEGVTCA